VQSDLVGYAVFAFVSLFTMVNPVGIVPVYLAMTSGMTAAQSRRVARRAVLTGTCILIGFALTGRILFAFFGISVDSLRVVGGIIFLLLGYQMLTGHVPRERQQTETVEDYATDISITPLGIPIVTGPGSIATAILLTTQDPDIAHYPLTVLVIVLVMAITYLMMVSGRRIMAVLGHDGTMVLMRLMGLIIMTIAIEFLVSGLTPIVREMLHLPA
jgi:multiple antibiotic resistance protein